MKNQKIKQQQKQNKQQQQQKIPKETHITQNKR